MIISDALLGDISPDFRPNTEDTRIARRLVALQGTPRALVYFIKHKDELTVRR